MFYFLISSWFLVIFAFSSFRTRHAEKAAHSKIVFAKTRNDPKTKLLAYLPDDRYVLFVTHLKVDDLGLAKGYCASSTEVT